MEEKRLEEELGPEHPKVKTIRAQIDIATDRFKDHLQAAEKENPGILLLRLYGYKADTATQGSGKPRFGVSVEPVPEAVAEHLGLPKNVGMVVTEVIPETPAAKIGVKAKDILVKIDGATVPSNEDDFVKLIAGLKSGRRRSTWW